MSLSLTIPWKPQAKERPRFNRKTGKAYTPKNTKLAEREIREEFLARRPDDFEPFDGPIAVKLILDDDRFRVSIEEVEPRVTLAADADNMGKLILDALNGVAWDDDSQIVDLRIVK